ncbi:MFS transporter [Verrucomicrobiaceae bacterium N1E253]|uniref:MFS transporter n=2 Tax=Oceaniferula marina TaxID=2748318 RepID=A0A851GHG3_9BACT|nr:MFS transporter [Oceaniferula marina]
MTKMSESAGDQMPTRRNWASFWSLLTLQTQNAFNDKAAQFLLIPLAGALVFAAKDSGQEVGFLGQNMAHVLGALIVLPFILFAPVAGWLSDRFSKTHVIRGTLCMQLAVFALIVCAVGMQSLPLAVLGFFLLSVESVLLSPAKKGIVKELVGHSRLGFASGVLEMSVILSVCFGQIISGWWYDARRIDGHGIWEAAHGPLMIVGTAALASLALSFGVERVKPMGKRPFSAGILFEHFGQLKDLWHDRRIRLSSVGIAFFWGFAGFINLAAIQIGSDLSGGGGVGFGSENSWLMLAASGGIALGGVLASLICKRKIELGLVPVGGAVMVLGSLALALGPIERGWLMIWMAIAGGGGAMLLVPLNAYLQDVCPPEKRGRVLAGLNLLDCLAGFVAVVAQFAMVHFGVSYGLQFGALALVSVVVSCYSARILPQQLVRFVLLALFRSVYRVKTMNAERIPRQGGVMLAPNHVSYIDAFILSVACPRPIRFVLFDEYFEHPTVGRFVRLFDAIPISKTRAKEGLRLASESLRDGEVVCIFPEGQLTRTGSMNAFMRGFEMIARRAKCPVIPVAMDGLWGSIFSFERNRFIYKKPYSLQYGVRVNIGEPMDAKAATAEALRVQMGELRSEAMLTRPLLQDQKQWTSLPYQVLFAADPQYLEQACAVQGEATMEQVANALQMADVNAVTRGEVVMVDWDGFSGVRDLVAVMYPLVQGLKLVIVSGSQSGEEIEALAGEHGVSAFFGGERLARIWQDRQLPGNCYDFSEGACERAGDQSGRFAFPCLVRGRCVISMALPDPKAQTRINDHQDGHRAGTWGRVLPGFVARTSDTGLKIAGLSLPDDKVVLEDAGVDDSGFVQY